MAFIEKLGYACVSMRCVYGVPGLGVSRPRARHGRAGVRRRRPPRLDGMEWRNTPDVAACVAAGGDFERIVCEARQVAAG